MFYRTKQISILKSKILTNPLNLNKCPKSRSIHQFPRKSPVLGKFATTSWTLKSAFSGISIKSLFTTLKRKSGPTNSCLSIAQSLITTQLAVICLRVRLLSLGEAWIVKRFWSTQRRTSRQPSWRIWLFRGRSMLQFT